MQTVKILDPFDQTYEGLSAESLNLLGVELIRVERYAEARHPLLLGLLRKPTRLEAAKLLANLGAVALYLGKVAMASQYMKMAERQFTEEKDGDNAVKMLCNLGSISSLMAGGFKDNPDKMREYNEKAISYYERALPLIADMESYAICEYCLGECLTQLGRCQEARGYLLDALHLLRSFEHPQVAKCLIYLAQCEEREQQNP